MRRTRQALAILLVATVLCADRGAAAFSSASTTAPRSAQAAEPAAASLTARIIRGLSRTLGSSADVALARQPVGPGRPAARGPVVLADQSADALHSPASPFQFRLPPPAPGFDAARA